MQPLLKNGDIVLFQGDSITDAGRDRRDPQDLGSGYAMLIAAWFQALYPTIAVKFLNRGVSGDRTSDLLTRWQKDCLNLRPTWLSLLVGVNDTWRRYDNNDETPTKVYEKVYRALLERTLATQNVRLILCEPFMLPVLDDQKSWREDLDPKIAITRQLAQEYGACYLPLDGLFAQVAAQREPTFWIGDGIHPTMNGHALIAQAWLRAMQAITS
jgi:acyl-CoA thioesterase-1